MTLEYCVSSARRLRELRLLAEAPSLRQRRAMMRRQTAAGIVRDVLVAGLVLLAGWIVGRVLS